MWMLEREAAGGREAAAGALGAGDTEVRALCTGRCRPQSWQGHRPGGARQACVSWGSESKGKGRG